MRRQPIWIDQDMKLARLSAGNADHCNSRQPCKLWANHVSRKVKETSLVAFVRCQAVPNDRKNSEGQTLDVSNFCGGRKRAGELRQTRLDQLQHLDDVDAPIEIETDF